MGKLSIHSGMSTLATHIAEGEHPLNAHVIPIFETSTFEFPDAATAAAVFKGEKDGYVYTRWNNPNQEQLAQKLTVLEGLDLLRERSTTDPQGIVAASVFGSGMAAVTATILACVRQNDTIIAQEALYGNSFNFLLQTAPTLGIQTAWLQDLSAESWEAAFKAHPKAKLAFVETPANPTMALVDLKAVAEIAHRYGAWLVVDNTFATPYCQRPLTLGADVVVHSTTKYLSGHGLIIGGAVISTHTDYVAGPLYTMLKSLGGAASPFDAWLTCAGLKTFELRMREHCQNAMQVARFLETHPQVSRVYYPGLESHSGHEIARRQMHAFGGMLSFELKGGLQAGARMMDRVQIADLVPSLGHVTSLVQHPASMSHASVSPDTRLKMGISDGLVRFSVGIENIEDIIADLGQAIA